MAMLPRLKPRRYYDLVIEVAIIRPGPIQGDMVHPYLRRRNGEEPVTYPSTEVEAVLERTLGVPIFQAQVMKLAVVAAGFTPGEADQLRRAMAAWRRRGGLEFFEQRLISGMRKRGYAEEFAQRIFNQIQGFGEYGFPESHAASFALLVYVSAWLKCHEPGVFCCALLNSQPMGFYAPAQLVRSAREHGVEVRAVDVNESDWDSTLESTESDAPAVRLGLRMIKGLSESGGARLLAARHHGRFTDIQSLSERAGLGSTDLGPALKSRHRY
jgi:error-prone DNA polymerase